MTCASCVKRVEKALSHTPGVLNATVNFATESATVEFLPGGVSRSDLRRVVEEAGYTIREPEAGTEAETGVHDHVEVARARELRTLKLKFGLSLAVGAILMALSFFPPSFLSRHELWLVMFVLATPIQFWAGSQFYRGAWASAKHLTTDMNTLIAVGTSIAYLYSAAVTFFSGFFETLAGSEFETAGLLRYGGDHHRTDPARSLPRSAGQGADRRRHQEADGPAGKDGPGGARRR